MPQTGQRGGAPVPCAPCVADAVQGEHRIWPQGASDESESRLRDEGEAVLAESGVRHDEHARWASGSGPCIEHSSVRLLSESGSGGQRRASSSSSPLLSLVLLISSSTRHGSTLSRSCQGLAVRCTARPPRRHPRVLDRPHPVPLLVAPLAQALEPDRLLVRSRVVAQDPRHPRPARPPRRRQALAPRRRPPPRAPPLGLGRPPLVARRHHCAHLLLAAPPCTAPKLTHTSLPSRRPNSSNRATSSRARPTSRRPLLKPTASRPSSLAPSGGACPRSGAARTPSSLARAQTRRSGPGGRATTCSRTSSRCVSSLQLSRSAPSFAPCRVRTGSRGSDTTSSSAESRLDPHPSPPRPAPDRPLAPVHAPHLPRQARRTVPRRRHPVRGRLRGARDVPREEGRVRVRRRGAFGSLETRSCGCISWPAAHACIWP